jgi:hypothetical protein
MVKPPSLTINMHRPHHPTGILRDTSFYGSLNNIQQSPIAAKQPLGTFPLNSKTLTLVAIIHPPRLAVGRSLGEAVFLLYYSRQSPCHFAINESEYCIPGMKALHPAL